MVGGAYERELKGILEADRKTLESVTKTTSVLETRNYFLIKKIPFYMVRAAGSLGIDLVAMRGEISFPIEVKSSKKRVLRLNSRYLGEQAESYLDVAKKANVVPLYAYRLKGERGETWRMFTLPFEVEDPKSLRLRRVPRTRVTRSGNYVLDWEEGMALNDFIKYIHALILE